MYYIHLSTVDTTQIEMNFALCRVLEMISRNKNFS